jgi:hypothetical protein
MPDRAICLTLLAEPTAPVAQGAAAGFRGMAYAGGVVPNHGWAGDMAIDLASLSLPPGDVPVLRNHDPDQIVGRARLSNDGTQLQVVDGRFSGVTDVARETSALMAEGHPWKLSVGINASMTSVDRAKPVMLNGRNLTVDSIYRNARVLELSFVPSGADPSAYAAQLSSRHGIQSPQAGEHMDPNPLQARVTELEAQVVTLTAERDTARTALTAAETSLATAATARRAERMTALFGADATLTDEQRAAYQGMTDAQFAAVEASLSAAVASRGGAAFHQQAPAGRDHQSAAGAAAAYVPPIGWNVDTERAQLHAKALKYQSEHAGTDYLTAVSAVAN